MAGFPARSAAWFLLILPVLDLTGCNAEVEEDPHRSAGLVVVNDTNQVLIATYDAWTWHWWGPDTLDERSDSIPPHTDQGFSVGYDDWGIPEFTLEGPGYERTVNVFGYQYGKKLVVLQRDLALGGG